MVAAIRKLAPKLISLSTPNNPTGNTFQRDSIEEIIRISGGIVVVDEAYQPFSREKSFIPDIKRFPRLAVTPHLQQDRLCRPSPRLSHCRQRADYRSQQGAAAIQCQRTFPGARAGIAASEERNPRSRQGDRFPSAKKMAKELRGMPASMWYRRMQTSFCSGCRMPMPFTSALIAAGILVPNLGSAVPNALRVTIGTPRKMLPFLQHCERS